MYEEAVSLSGVTFDFLNNRKKHGINRAHIVASNLSDRSKLLLMFSNILAVMGCALHGGAGFNFPIPQRVNLTMGTAFLAHYNQLWWTKSLKNSQHI